MYSEFKRCSIKSLIHWEANTISSLEHYDRMIEQHHTQLDDVSFDLTAIMRVNCTYPAMQLTDDQISPLQRMFLQLYSVTFLRTAI